MIQCTTLEYFDFTRLTKLTSIDGFVNCKALAGTLDLSKTKLTSIENSAFNGCSGFTGDIDLSMLPLKKIGEKAFTDTNLEKISLPDSVESIGTLAFNGPNFYFASPYLPRNLTYVGQQFINGTKKLNELLVFSIGVTQLIDEKFSGCQLEDKSKTFTIVFLGKMTRVWFDGTSYTDWAKQTNVYFAQNCIDDVKAKVYAFTDKEAGALGEIIRDNTSTGTLSIDIASRSPSSTTKVGDNYIRFIFCQGNNIEVSHMLTTAGLCITEDRGTFIMDGHAHYVLAH